MRGRRVWFETVMTTGPAPTFEGETVTLSLWITPLSPIGTGGRGSFLKSSSPQPATRAAEIATPPALLPSSTPRRRTYPNQTDPRASRRSSSSSWMRVRIRSESRCTSATSSASSGP